MLGFPQPFETKNRVFPTLCNCLSFIYLLSSIVINFFQNYILNLEVSKLGITAQPTLLLSIFYEINNQESGRETECLCHKGLFFSRWDHSAVLAYKNNYAIFFCYFSLSFYQPLKLYTHLVSFYYQTHLRFMKFA